MYSLITTITTGRTTWNDGIEQVVQRYHYYCRHHHLLFLPVPVLAQQQLQHQPTKLLSTKLLPYSFTSGMNQLSSLYSCNGNGNDNLRYFFRRICYIRRYSSIHNNNSSTARRQRTKLHINQQSNGGKIINNIFLWWKNYHPRRMYNKLIQTKRRYQLWGMIIGILTIGSIIKVVYFKYSRQMIVSDTNQKHILSMKYLQEANNYAKWSEQDRQSKLPHITHEQRNQIYNYLNIIQQHGVSQSIIQQQQEQDQQQQQNAANNTSDSSSSSSSQCPILASTTGRK